MNMSYFFKFQERSQNEIEINDIDPDILELFLNYLYTGQISNQNDLNEDKSSMLLIAADKYQVNDLKAFAAKQLMAFVSLENAPQLCVLAKMHNCKELKDKMMFMMADHLDCVRDSDGWKAIESGHRDIWKDVMTLAR